MIVTKTEFKEMFGYKYASEISRLLKRKTIVENDSGMINLDDKVNKKFVKNRKKELKQKESEGQIGQSKTSTKTIKTKDESQIGIEVELLNQKLKAQQQQATLLDLKIAKETKEVVETAVLDKVLMTIFNQLFQNLAELPSIYVDDIVTIIKTEKNPKEQTVKFLTDKIIQHIKSSLDVAENAAKKHYSS